MQQIGKSDRDVRYQFMIQERLYDGNGKHSTYQSWDSLFLSYISASLLGSYSPAISCSSCSIITVSQATCFA